MSFSLRANVRSRPNWADLLVALIVAFAALIVACASAPAHAGEVASVSIKADLARG
ncbi:hypothetical protein [Lichenihabitans psoromatis]|uniref:hypothetical protein n=1 Tax=Lichenihabitans psoromatis TaxID=2528642 RepID=UPI0013F16A08|nr:hypothetical protein [Lichenihabitans psoromatis]